MVAKLKVVLDTNCIISSISLNSPNRIIIDNLLDGNYIICVSNEILWNMRKNYLQYSIEV